MWNGIKGIFKINTSISSKISAQSSLTVKSWVIYGQEDRKPCWCSVIKLYICNYDLTRICMQLGCAQSAKSQHKLCTSCLLISLLVLYLKGREHSSVINSYIYSNIHCTTITIKFCRWPASTISTRTTSLSSCYQSTRIKGISGHLWISRITNSRINFSWQSTAIRTR